MRNVVVLGVAMTKFGKSIDKTLPDLGTEAVLGAVNDAGISIKDIQIAHVGNLMAGVLSGQFSNLGQAVLWDIGLGGIPIFNEENACASSICAFFGAWMAVASGYADVALALGVEKMYGSRAGKAGEMLAGTGIELDTVMGRLPVFKYAKDIKDHMREYGTTQEQIAMVSVKNHKNGSLNPYAQYRDIFTLDDVMNSRVILWPFTLLMIAPIGDGASALILTSEDVARKHTTKPVYVADIEITSPVAEDLSTNQLDDVEMLSKRAYEKTGIGPQDVGVVELHEAMSSAEILRYELLGFCPKGEGGRFIEEGKSEITGTTPVNTSGGLEAKGHPVGATGCAMITQLTWQLRGDAGDMQVNPVPKVGLAQNGGGFMFSKTACQTISLLKT